MKLPSNWTKSSLIQDVALHFSGEFVEEFWRFVNARHEIYRKRFVFKEPAPWTDDPVLQKVFFTNVYRELDKGTQYYQREVLGSGDPVADLFETLVYRQFNNVRTYQFMKSFRRQGDWEDWEGIAAKLTEYGQENNTNIFTDAHMTTGIKWGGFDDKPRNVSWMIRRHWHNRESIYKEVMEAESLKERHKIIENLEGFGPFLAYEVVTDLGYSEELNPRGFTEDDWANPGPGCRKAIDLILPPNKRKQISVTYEDVILALRVLQNEYFEFLEIGFNFLDERELTLRNIEHSLCEFYKYSRAKHSGKARRKYHPGGRR